MSFTCAIYKQNICLNIDELTERSLQFHSLIHSDSSVLCSFCYIREGKNTIYETETASFSVIVLCEIQNKILKFQKYFEKNYDVNKDATNKFKTEILCVEGLNNDKELNEKCLGV